MLLLREHFYFFADGIGAERRFKIQRNTSWLVSMRIKETQHQLHLNPTWSRLLNLVAMPLNALTTGIHSLSEQAFYINRSFKSLCGRFLRKFLWHTGSGSCGWKLFVARTSIVRDRIRVLDAKRASSVQFSRATLGHKWVISHCFRPTRYYWTGVSIDQLSSFDGK